MNVYSNPVDSVLAKTIAKNYFEFLNPLRTNIKIKNTITIYYNGHPSYYIINFIDGGYITVSANDATVPILSYSYGGEYKEDDFYNPAYLEWMENYSKEIDSVRANNIDNSISIIEWNNILNKNFSKYKNVKSVQPLITTKWGQTWNNDDGYPGYNYFCPSSSGCNDDRCDAGCVAIAMAQVMKYWVHPVHSTYQDYDWCNMPDELKNYSTMTEVEAVARLIYDCGVKASMSYCFFGSCESFAWPSNAINALVNDFGYSNDANIDRRQYYSKTTWITKLKNELNNGRPVIYFALNGLFGGGHAFVLDGYNIDDEFHINWGWHGNQQGYYEIGDLTLGSYNYNTKQRAIFNLHPDWYVNCNSMLHVLQIYQNISPVIYYNPVAGTIMSGGNNTPVTIQNGQTVHYRAYNEIVLEDGFTAEEGSDFIAEIIPCPAECTNNNSKSIIIISDNYSEDVEYENFHNNYTDVAKKETDDLKLRIYPNPVSKIINIEYNKNIKKISIINITGKKCISKTFNGHTVQVDMSGLPNGFYFINIITQDNNFTYKVIKK